ncbi:hypothetical protein J6590_058907 [Homalodisca vitripennis]|nr:hypothetical protein J6590_058907 [Homalodisca vitripennis]
MKTPLRHRQHVRGTDYKGFPGDPTPIAEYRLKVATFCSATPLIELKGVSLSTDPLPTPPPYIALSTADHRDFLFELFSSPTNLLPGMNMYRIISCLRPYEVVLSNGPKQHPLWEALLIVQLNRDSKMPYEEQGHDATCARGLQPQAQ